MALRNLPNLLRSWCGAVSGAAIRMVDWPDIVLQAGWDKCLCLDGV